MKMHWEKIWSFCKVLIGIYGLILMALAFSVPNHWWVIAVPVSLPFVIFGFLGYLDLTGKSVPTRIQILSEFALVIILFPSISAAVQAVVSGQKIEAFSLEFGLPFIFYPATIIDLLRLGFKAKRERSNTTKEK